jgi:hypothetical protein
MKNPDRSFGIQPLAFSLSSHSPAHHSSAKSSARHKKMEHKKCDWVGLIRMALTLWRLKNTKNKASNVPWHFHNAHISTKPH